MDMCFSLFCQVNGQTSTATEDWKSGPGTTSPGNGKPGQMVDGKMVPNQEEKWEGVEDVPANTAMGHLHLSFEYHKTNLKIRVWQVSDLLLPPPQTSMIESVFVRSYLIPDMPKKTNRKTEDVRVESASKDISKPVYTLPKSGIQHIFTPSSFRFDTPLLYTGVTQDIISGRSVQLEVCMTQKHTHKAFLIAMVHMPLHTAVRRPIRQKYPLIPCMNYTIPNNMRVYSAREVFLDDSHIDYSRSNSFQSNGDSNNSVTLDSIETDIPVRKFIAVDISVSDSEDKEDEEEDDDDDVDDGIGSSVDVKICSGKDSGSPTVMVDMLDNDADDNETFSQLTQVVSHKTPDSNLDTSVVEVKNSRESKTKKKIIPFEKVITPSSESPPAKIASSVVEIEEELKSTVVDMTTLQGDVVLDVDSSIGTGSKTTTTTSSRDFTPEQDLTSEAPKRKKKIIPFELDKTAEKSSEAMGVAKEENNNSSTSHHKMSPIQVTVTDDSSSQRDQELLGHESKEEDDIAQELACLPSASSELSTGSQEHGSTPTPNSRPETPIWDYYDFAEEDKKDNEDTDNVEATAPDSTSKEQGTKTTSTLQESLARLSRPQTTLDTCRVAGPVLPSVIVDDFEMDDE